MFVSRRLKCGHHWKHLSMNQFLFLISILTTVHEVQAESDLSGTSTTTTTTTTTNGIATGTACAERWTCTSCTEGTTPSCSWSVAEQTCADSVVATELSRLVVTDRSSCPKFSVENIFSVMADDKVTITVTVDDGHEEGGFVDLLANSSVKCQLNNRMITAKVNGDRISCTLTYTRSRYNVKCRDFVPVVSHLLISFDDKFLRFDNASDHYATGYPSDCPVIECLDCNRNNGTHRTYCTRCSKNNTTSVNTKPFHYCEVRKNSNFEKSNSDKTKNGDMCGDSADPAMMLRSDQLKPEVPAGNYSSFPIISTVSTISTVTMVPIVPTVPIVPMVPTVDDGQTFGGIASGGTTIVAKGRSFSGLQNAKACFVNKSTCVYCSILNDTSMECRSPKFIAVNETQTAVEIKPLKFYGKDPAGNVLKLNSNSFEYHLYQDPVFTDYMVNGCCNLTVNGVYLYQGYTTGDLSIVLDTENSSSVCGPITWMDGTQIVCHLSQLDPLPNQIYVKAGDYISVVKLTKQNSSKFKNSLAAIILPSVVTIGAYISFIAVLCVALIFFKSSKDYDLLHLHGPQHLAEMRPLDEKNFNDYDNNSESNNMLSKHDE
ncbi:uncharacterized protein LOC114131449 isoform X2 [Aphis gossypii]|nr:uncharacterized protein LOC114131449 isoform X2 [Aphis gossypii]